MFVRPRLSVAAVATLVTLGAGAAPALASGRGPAAQEALKLQPTIQLNVGPYGTAAQKRKTIAQLLASATKCDYAAQLVSRTHPAVTDGRDLWVKGVRLAATGQRELAAGLRLELAGQTAAGRQKVNAATNGRHSLLTESNFEIVHADKMLGIYRAIARAENGG